ETLHSLERHMAHEIAVAEAVICVSESTRRDLLEFYEIDPSRVFAIHSGVIPSREDGEGSPQHMRGGSLASLGMTRRYILFVSTIEPRKNLEVLLDAFGRLSYDGELVVVGKIGWKAEGIMAR